MSWASAGKSREGEMYRRVVRQLIAHVGGSPSHAQELVIARIAWLQVHLARIDERAMADGGLSPHASREYLAWSNTIARLVCRLGLRGAPERQPTLAEIIAAAATSSGPPSAPASPTTG